MSFLTSTKTTNPAPYGIPDPLPTGHYKYLIDEKHPLRQQVEQFIAQRFFEVHGARLSVFMPVLIALFGENEEILAAVGIRSAATEVLFLEYYLDTSIEQSIACNAKQLMVVPERDRIVEIGNLASIDRRVSRKLFKILAGLLHAENFKWAVFTGCTSLHRMFSTLGIETIDLGRALQSRLPVDQQTWGGYYEDSPRVVAGKVSRGCIAFESTPDMPLTRALA
ncbi:MAG: thermostable hemolysin [Gammaproteobacteria bacterium]|nr:thermostable hemolysin [Gammaproteobacteria bacterium]